MYLKKIKPSAIYLIAACAILAVVTVIYLVNRKPAASVAKAVQAAPSVKPALTVTISQPQAQALPIQLSANGTVAAWQEAVVGSESNGLRLAEVTSAELGRLKVGTGVNITAASGANLQGRVRMVAPTVDPQTRTGLVYVDLPALSVSHAGAAKPGMFARGEFALGNSQALTVPQQAVVVRDGFSYVFRLNADQRVSQIKLQIGRRAGDRVEVLEGITADAVLVASGAGFLNDGDLVKVAPVEKKASNSPLAPARQAEAATK